ncbi:MAG: PH domain-containing protein, partial [Bhargavaea sp.]
LTLETGADGEDASVKFPAVTKAEAARIEEALDGYRRERMMAAQTVTGAESMEGEASEIQEPLPEKVRTIHFTPELKDVLKASFLSFSFIALIPVLATVYSNIDDFIDIESRAEGFLSFLTGSGVVLGITIALFAVAAIAFGIIRTYLKYGRYEISSDDERIYIRRGVLTEQSLSVRKKNVQAVQITETPLKRLLGLAEAKLVTVGSFEDNLEDISSLYPFLRKQRAVELVGELLPDIEVLDRMERLPKAGLTVRMLRFPFIAVIATVALFFWRPDFPFVPDWPFLAAALFAFTYLLRYFDYRNTRYAIRGPFVQFRKGGLWRETFLSRREKVIEAAVSQSWLQKRFGVATIGTTNRAKPVHVEELKDLPGAAAEQFDRWYTERKPELIRADGEAEPWKTLQSES